MPEDPEIMTGDKILWTEPNFIGTVIFRNIRKVYKYFNTA